VKFRTIRQARWFSQDTKNVAHNGSWSRPLGGSCSAAAMIVTAVVVIIRFKRGLRRFSSRRRFRLRRLRLRHRMMALHRRLRHRRGHSCGHRLTHTLHGLR
jgi:hypothetical protein